VIGDPVIRAKVLLCFFALLQAVKNAMLRAKSAQLISIPPLMR
jgi:hypothetical protein